ncbi:MAG TPA: hypothetical protein VG346_15310 [Acidimicrobiales bacterium]|jgi:hypothetical protein|nr:hypothetical protein [Acidimicrobiales bacterium]
MTTSDYLIDITLISLVLIQIRARKLSVKALLLPLGLVSYVAYEYLRGVPTAHNDLFLVVGAAVVGATLGGLAGSFTSVRRADDGSVWAKAGLAAAALWILGTGGRLAFQLYASHGGGASIAHFSASHGITSATAWTAALILMALSEATMRTTVLGWRFYSLGGGAAVAPSAPAPAPADLVSFPPVRTRVPVSAGTRSMMDNGDDSLS